MMTVGGFLANCRRRCWPPRIATSSSLTICTTCCAGFSARLTSSPSARSRTFAVNSLHHHERDVGVEEGAPDLADGAVDVGGRQLALGAEVAEGLGEPVGEGAESRHDPSSLRERRATARVRRQPAAGSAATSSTARARTPAEGPAPVRPAPTAPRPRAPPRRRPRRAPRCGAERPRRGAAAPRPTPRCARGGAPPRGAARRRSPSRRPARSRGRGCRAPGHRPRRAPGSGRMPQHPPPRRLRAARRGG